MQKIVINTCFGGFGLSRAAKAWLNEKAGEDVDLYSLPRDSELLVRCVELFGSAAASGDYAKLKVVEVPDGVKWYIEEYDGREHVAADHETWS